VRQDVNKQMLPVGALSRAENVRFGRAGEVTCRPGSTAVPAGTTTADYVINGGEAIGPICRLGSADMLGSAGHMYARVSDSELFSFVGCYSSAAPVRRRPGLPNNGQTTLGPNKWGCAANSDGYVLLAAPAGQSGTQIYWVVESPEGVRIHTGVETGSKCLVVAQGSTLLLVVQNGTNVSAYPITISGGVVNTITPATVATLSSSAHYWDVSAYDSSSWLIVYQSSATNVAIFRNNVTSLTDATSFSVTGTVPFSIWGDSTNGRVWVGYYDNPTVAGTVAFRAFTVSPSFAPLTNGTIVVGADVYGPPLFGRYQSSSSLVFFVHRRCDLTSPYVTSTRSGTVSTAGTVTTFTPTWHVAPLSKPDDMRVWCLHGSPVTTYQRAVLLRFRPSPSPMPIGFYTATLELAADETESVYQTNLPTATYDNFSAVATSATPTKLFPLPRLLQRGPAGVASDLVRLEFVEYTVSSQASHREAVELGDSLVVSGQAVQFFGLGSGSYDSGGSAGQSQAVGAAEVGFAYRPVVLSATQGAGGNLTALGVYSWQFAFEWSDALNRRHRSAPSAPYTLTLTGGNQQVTFQLSSCEFTQKYAPGMTSGVRIVAYRTKAGGSTSYRETLPDAAPNASDFSDGQVQYVSGNSASHTDTVIGVNEVIYTDGGVRENVLAPSGSYLCRSEERLWVGGQWEPQVITASKIIVPDEAIQFSSSAAFSVVLPDACTGLAYQDGAVIAFCKRAIYAITGDGPNDQGVGSWSAPRAISREVGCENNRSILETAQGVMFQNARGWWLIPRGLGQPAFIGAPIQRTSAGATCYGACVTASSYYRLARFSTSAGVLVYDLDLGAWSLDTYQQSIGSCGAWNTGALFSLTTPGTYVGYLDSNNTRDFGVPGTPETITALVETGAMRPWGLAGYGNVASMIGLFSEVSGSPTLSMRIYLDGLLTGPDGTLLTADFIRTWTGSANAEDSYKQLVPKQGHCTSVRLYTTIQPGSSGGATLHGWQLATSPLGERRTPQAER
jgi:hypothetical protein